MSLSFRTTAARRVARLAATFGVVLAGLGTACADAPSAPVASAQPELPQVRLSKTRGGSGETRGVARVRPLAAPVAVTFTVDPSRASRVTLPGAGLEIHVPRGAVAEPVEITATALPGEYIAYDFQPHGLVFRQPLQMRQDLRHVDWSRVNLFQLSNLEIAYFADPSALHTGDGVIPVQEFLGALFDLIGGRAEFDVHHFSGYIVAWGRSRSYSGW